ncbi:GID complex subunit containing RING finger motif [Gonapodya sp. JEL0774]|nr:GID complex subunit containing RING finger motif [Gonapodya sp. JEL0774]
MADKTKLNIEALLQLEQPLISVPLEQIRKTLRTSQRLTERELTQLATQASELAAKAAPAPGSDGTGTGTDDAEKKGVTAEEAAAQLNSMIERMQKLKRKLQETKSDESASLSRTRHRLSHLDELASVPSSDSPEYARWCKVRLDRVLVEYLLRRGWGGTAGMVAAAGGIEPLADIDLFTQTRTIEASLEAKSSAECLAWCADNRSGLKKIKSTLEFQLRLQDYIELVRARKTSDALSYARKHLAPHAQAEGGHLDEVQRAMALLAFKEGTGCERYKRQLCAQLADDASPAGIDVASRTVGAQDAHVQPAGEPDGQLPDVRHEYVWRVGGTVAAESSGVLDAGVSGDGGGDGREESAHGTAEWVCVFGEDRKAHRNGIKKAKRQRHPSLKGVDPKFLRNQRFAKKGIIEARKAAKEE